MEAKKTTPAPYLRRITIVSLSIRNFKGCASLTLYLNCHSADIFGDNAAGKTTIYDALTWLLFGKDSSGAGKFNIKPLSPDGTVRDHAAETSVEAEFLVDAAPVTLRRTYKELWTKKRGRSEAVFDGHVSEFFYNGLPVSKQDYEARVGLLCDESTFRTLTDVRWFCAGESEANRRSALFALIGGVSEEEVLESDEAFAPLTGVLNGLTVDEYKTAAQKQRRTLQGRSRTIPARIDEQKRTVTEYQDVDFDSLRRQREELAAKESEAKAELDALNSDSALVVLRERKKALSAQLDALEQRNTAHRHAQREPGQLHHLNREMRGILDELRRMDEDQRREDEEAKLEQSAIDELRARWHGLKAKQNEAQAKTFDGADDTCPTCGQKLPPEMVEQHRERWEQEHARLMEKLAAEKQDCITWAKRHSDRVKELEQRKKERLERRKELEQRQAELTKESEALKGQQVTDLPGYEKESFELEEQIRVVGEQIRAAEEGSNAARSVARKKLAELTDQIRRLDSMLACEGMLNNARNRVQELTNQLHDVGEETERLDALLDLCDAFARAKAAYIDQKVNGMFRLVRWKLFEEQVNGGVRDCCVATVNGVPYSDLNSGAKINAGLDVIRTMSAAKRVTVPLFIDNAESVTRLEGVDTQVIRLVVSEEDKKLRVEVLK